MTLKGLIVFLILTTSSGCATKVAPPLCLERDFILEDITVFEQREIRDEVGPDVLRRIAENDAKLKIHINKTEQLVTKYNELFTEGECFEDEEH